MHVTNVYSIHIETVEDGYAFDILNRGQYEEHAVISRERLERLRDAIHELLFL